MPTPNSNYRLEVLDVDGDNDLDQATPNVFVQDSQFFPIISNVADGKISVEINDQS